MNLWTDLGTLPRTRLRCTIMQPVGFLYVRATNVFFCESYSVNISGKSVFPQSCHNNCSF